VNFRVIRHTKFVKLRVKSAFSRQGSNSDSLSRQAGQSDTKQWWKIKGASQARPCSSKNRLALYLPFDQTVEH